MIPTRPWHKIRWQIWLTLLITVVLSAFIYQQVNKPIEIAVTSSPIGQNKTLKERMIFIVNLEKSFQKRGWPASIDLEGADGKTLKVYWEKLNLPFVRGLVKSQDLIAYIREMGFKHLIMTDGKISWDIDLKNLRAYIIGVI